MALPCPALPYLNQLCSALLSSTLIALLRSALFCSTLPACPTMPCHAVCVASHLIRSCTHLPLGVHSSPRPLRHARNRQNRTFTVQAAAIETSLILIFLAAALGCCSSLSQAECQHHGSVSCSQGVASQPRVRPLSAVTQISASWIMYAQAMYEIYEKDDVVNL
jgi:hypothetical protein